MDQVSEPIPLGGQWLLVTYLYSATGQERAGVPGLLAQWLDAAGGSRSASLGGSTREAEGFQVQG